MDRKTLDNFQDKIAEGTPTFAQNLAYLNAEEQQLFDFLKQNNLRLEQEKIPVSEVLNYIL